MGISVAGQGADSAWITPAMLNGWVAYDPANYSTFRYRKLSNGMVVAKGLIKSGTAADIFTFPAGYRPLEREIFTVTENSLLARVDVLPTGLMTRQMGGNTWLALSGIQFYAEQ
jgi:hypothetical protein